MNRHPIAADLSARHRPVHAARSRTAAAALAAMLALPALAPPSPGPGRAAAQEPDSISLDPPEDARDAPAEDVLPEKGTLTFVVQPATLRDSTRAQTPIPGSRATDLIAAVIGSFGIDPLSSADLAARGLDWDAFAAKARDTARRHLATLKPEVTRDARDIPEFAVLRSRNPVTHTVVFTTEFFERFKPLLGDRLLVAIPDRYTVYVFPRSMGTFRRFGKQITERYLDALYPVSHELFEVDENGIRAAGSFLEE